MLQAGTLRTPDGRRPGVTLAQLQRVYPGCRWTDQHWSKALRGEGWSPHVTMIKERRLHYWLPAGMVPQQRGRPKRKRERRTTDQQYGVPGPRTPVFVDVNRTTGETRLYFKRAGRFIQVDPDYREIVRARWRRTNSPSKFPQRL